MVTYNYGGSDKSGDTQDALRISSCDIPTEEHLVVVQPHLDDAVLSAFSLMTAARRITVIAVCAGLPPAGTAPSTYDSLTGSSDPRGRMEQRRQEDLCAMGVLDAQSEHLDFLDVPYRTEELPPKIIEQEVRRVLPEDTSCIAVPVGLGTHPDHLLVAAVGTLLEHDHKVVKFADYPYAAVCGWPAWVNPESENKYLNPESSWHAALERLGPETDIEAVVVTLSTAEQQRKLEVFTNYETQVAATEEGPSQLVSHPDRIKYEVFWRRRTK